MYVEGICRYASPAGKVILVAGSQTNVPDLESTLRGVHKYGLPWEDEQVRKAINMGTFVSKILIVSVSGSMRG